MKERRRELRSRSTDAEGVLWKELRNNKLGVRFKRQFSISGMVIDFYCPRRKIAIEIDGAGHKNKDVMQYDLYKTKYLEAGGIKVIRFWNGEVSSDSNKVIEKIRGVINTSPPTPLLSKERGTEGVR